MTNNLICCLFDASDVFKRCNDVTMISRRVSSHGFAEIYIQYNTMAENLTVLDLPEIENLLYKSRSLNMKQKELHQYLS